MIAKLAYLTTPAPGRYVLNIQPFGAEGIMRIEIGRAHLENIVIDGTSLALRESSNRVPSTSNLEIADGSEHRS